ncbi:MAG: ABA4-like family protein [Longimicrobiales bacterium]
MYRLLFDLAGFAIVGWLPLIFAPTWRVTRRIAESAIFPAYLAAIYVVGAGAVLTELGPGIMADFGSAEGVLGLLRLESVALVAWIHILTFDQVVAILIYRDNMRHRFLPLPVQSVLLVVTLMFAPVGFLAYWLVRVLRGKRGLMAWGEPAPESEPASARTARADASAQPVRFSDVVSQRSVSGVVLGLWQREKALVRLGGAGFVLAAICAVVAAVNGGWLLGAEGRLLEATKFNIALGIYWLSLALMVPLAGFSARGRARWIAWAVGFTVFNYGMENVQSWRGLDPRLSNVAGPIDQIMGGVFFVSALGTMVLFIILTRRFFRQDTLPDHPNLRVALRYGCTAALLGFAAGIAMSFTSGRVVNGAGNMMPIHAAGFHGLQALPLVALLLGWSVVTMETARGWIHVAGISWLLFCLGLILQPILGRPPFQPGAPLAFSLVGFMTWAAMLIYALRARTVAARALSSVTAN